MSEGAKTVRERVLGGARVCDASSRLRAMASKPDRERISAASRMAEEGREEEREGNNRRWRRRRRERARNSVVEAIDGA